MEFFIGTYSFPIVGVEANGEGIYSVSFDPESGSFGTPTLVTQCLNPSYLSLSSDGKQLFACKEVFTSDTPAIQYLLMDTQTEHSLFSHPVQGEIPCHVTLHEATRRVATAQYWTGEVSLFEYGDNGDLTPINHIVHQGEGPLKARQEGPHAHQVTFTDNGSCLHNIDLGSDKVWSYRLSDTGEITEKSECAVPAGCGPRHMVTSPDGHYAYVACELDESVLVLSRSGLGWQFEYQLQAFERPADVEGSIAAIRLSPDGRFLYVSGRRQSQIALFAISDDYRTLHYVDAFETGGSCPRDFTITSDGNWVIAGNQLTNSLASLRRDTATGRLLPPVDSVYVPTPVSIVEKPA